MPLLRAESCNCLGCFSFWRALRVSFTLKRSSNSSNQSTSWLVEASSRAMVVALCSFYVCRFPWVEIPSLGRGRSQRWGWRKWKDPDFRQTLRTWNWLDRFVSSGRHEIYSEYSVVQCFRGKLRHLWFADQRGCTTLNQDGDQMVSRCHCYYKVDAMFWVPPGEDGRHQQGRTNFHAHGAIAGWGTWFWMFGSRTHVEGPCRTCMIVGTWRFEIRNLRCIDPWIWAGQRLHLQCFDLGVCSQGAAIRR